MRNVQKSITSILREHSIRKHLALVVCMIAAATVLAVFWSLHLNGITLSSGDLICGLTEHTHTADCYAWLPVEEETEGNTEPEETGTETVAGTEIVTETETGSETETVTETGTESAMESVLTAGTEAVTEEETETAQVGDTKIVNGVEYVYTLICGMEEHMHTDVCYESASSEENSAAEKVAEEISGTESEDASETASESVSEESNVTAGVGETFYITRASGAASSTALDATTSAEETYYVADAVTLEEVDKTGATDYIVYTVINGTYYVLDANGRLRKVNGLNSGSSISWASDDNLEYYTWNVTQATDSNSMTIDDTYYVYNTKYNQYLSPTYSPISGTDDDVTIGTGFSDSTGSVTISGDFELTYTFTNICNGSSNWHNYIVEMVSNSTYLDLRADNYGWIKTSDYTINSNGAITDGSKTANTSDDTLSVGNGADNWDTWLAGMKNASVTVNIVKKGAYVYATMKVSGYTFTATAYVEEFEDANLTIYLTGENCALSGISYTYNNIVDDVNETEVSSYKSGSLDGVTVAGACQTKTTTLELAGDFILEYEFTNTGDTENSSETFNNFIVEMWDSQYVYLDIVANNSGWIYGGKSIDTLTFGDGLSDESGNGSTDDEWVSWLETMKKGTTVNVTVERIGGYVTVTMEAADETFTATAYISNYVDGRTLYVCLTGEQCTLSDITYSYYTPVSMRTNSSAQTTTIVLADASSNAYAWTSTATLSSNLRSGAYTMLAQSYTGYIEWATSTDNTNYLECLESSTPSAEITFVFAEVRSFTVHFDATNGGAGFYAKFPSYTSTTYEMDADGKYYLVDASGATTSSSLRFNSYTAEGWYDIYSNTYYDYDSSNLVYEFAYDAERNVTVCYTDWVPYSYDGGSSTDSYRVDGVDTSSFITTRVYDYNDFFDLYSAYLDKDKALLSASDHSEASAWTFTYYTNTDSDSNLILNNLETRGLGVLFWSNVYSGVGLFSPTNRATLKLGNRTINGGNDKSEDVRTTGLTSSTSSVVGFDSENLLNYLYDTSGSYGPYAAGTGIMGKTYVGEGNYLYQYSSDTGYYYFDSSQNAAFYNQSEKRFYLYSYLIYKSGSTSTSDFLPFNYFNVGTVSSADAKIGLDSNSIDYFFGMSSEIEFYLPDATGTYNINTGYGNQSSKGSNMVFKFMGDDDVWVYVDYGTDDEQLVLDLGGIHDAVYGEIDFSTGLVTVITNTSEVSSGTTYVDACVTTTNNIIGINSSAVTYANPGSAGEITYTSDGSKVGTVTTLSKEITAGSHTLTIFYLERGAGESNCAICLNLSSETYNLKLTKWAEEALGTSLSGAKFTYYTSTNFTEDNEASLKDSSASTANTVSTFDAGVTAYSLRVGRTYYIKETAYPEGYTDSGRYLSVTLSRDGVLTVIVYSSGGTVIETYTLTYNSTDGSSSWSDTSKDVWDSVIYDNTNYSNYCYMTYTAMSGGVAGHYDIGLIIQNTKAYEIPSAGSTGIFPYWKAGLVIGMVSITGLLILAFYRFVWARKLYTLAYKKELTEEKKNRQKCFAQMRGHPRERTVTHGHARDRPDGWGISPANGSTERRRGTGPGG